MKNLAKLIVVFAFALSGLFVLLSGADVASVLAQVAPKATPTPAPANTKPAAKVPTNTAANTAANAAANVAAPASGGGDKKIRKSFTLSSNSLTEYGAVAFDHETHAEGKYSPDGKSVIGCVECHHSDQPKSALKPPYVTSERNETLTMEVYRKSSQKVSECRTCHFQAGNVPEGKEMPVLENGQELHNEYAYHQNCNVCHDAAAKLRPELKVKKGFATTSGCFVCHVKN